MSKRVVVTGIGIVSPYGTDKDDFFKAVYDHKKRADVDLSKAAVKASEFIDGSKARKMSKVAQYGVIASKLALEDSGLTMENRDPRSIGVIVGNAIGSGKNLDKYLTTVERFGGSKASPMGFVSIMHQEAAAQISLNSGIQGFHITLTTLGCGLPTIFRGADLIKAGRANVVLAGGAEEISPAFLEIGRAQGYFSKLDSDSEVFSSESKGSRYSEGACILVLEDLDHAVGRGARIYGEIRGYASKSDVSGEIFSVSPDGSGLDSAIRGSVAKSGISVEQIDAVFTSANGYFPSDSVENKVLKSCGLQERTPIIPSKVAMGECFGASGAMQVAAALKSMENNLGFSHMLIESIYPGGENNSVVVSRAER